MNEEVVDLFHKVIDATIIVVSNPREQVVNDFLQGVFEVRSKASSLRANRPQGSRIGIKTNETVSSHQKVPVATGTFVGLHLAVSQAEILFRVLKERLDAPAHPIGANNVIGRCVDFVRGEVLDRILFVFDVTLNGVDALFKRIDADLFASVSYLSIAPERADPSLPLDLMCLARLESWANHEWKT